MRHIAKGKEPRVLTQYRLQPHASYDQFDGKDELSGALAREQGYLCAYCMQRIEPDTAHMKIEHWKAQSTHRDLELNWRNMLGVCMGREGQPRKRQHCDSFRRNLELVIDPLDHPERYLSYTIHGEIRADQRPDIQHDIDKNLNLNVETLMRSRRQAWDAVYDGLKRLGNEAFMPAALQRKITDLAAKDREGKYIPFCEVMIYLLKKKKRRQVPGQASRSRAAAKPQKSSKKGK